MVPLPGSLLAARMADLTPDLQRCLLWGSIAESFHALQSLSVSCFHVIVGLRGPCFPFRMRFRSSMPSHALFRGMQFLLVNMLWRNCLCELILVRCHDACFHREIRKNVSFYEKKDVLSPVSLNIFLFINTDTIHVNINIFQLGFSPQFWIGP